MLSCVPGFGQALEQEVAEVPRPPPAEYDLAPIAPRRRLGRPRELGREADLAEAAHQQTGGHHSAPGIEDAHA